MPTDPKATAKDVHKRMRRSIPDPAPELDFETPWQLLVATILSAQSTDKTVNRVTPALFLAFPSASALAAASQDEVEVLVKSTGFFRNKAKSIRNMSAMLTERFGGEVPKTMEALVELPGVARKTANLVLGAAFGIASGIVVDTHAGRVARRLGLTSEKDPTKVERDLCALFPSSQWIETGNQLVLHGRYVCTSKNPRCAQCPLNEICDSRESSAQRRWTVRADREAACVRSRGETPI